MADDNVTDPKENPVGTGHLPASGEVGVGPPSHHDPVTADTDDDPENMPSVDDLLEERNGNSPEVGNNPLPEDNARPAADATDPEGKQLPEDAQPTDTNVDSDEAYNEGAAEAAEARGNQEG